MLGILPSSGAVREPSPHKEQRFSFRKGSTRGGPLPAKCIQVTEILQHSLNLAVYLGISGIKPWAKVQRF